MSPTVPRADTDSYRASVKVTGEVAEIKIAPSMPRAIIITAMVMASSTWAWGMVRLNTQTELRPLARAIKNRHSTMKVTVFSPPAVEPEEPPMSMNTTLMALPPSVSCP